MFNKAPILNPYGPSGINLVIDHSTVIDKWGFIDFDSSHTDLPGNDSTANFLKLKQLNFNSTVRGKIYRYTGKTILLRHDRKTGVCGSRPPGAGDPDH